jgi:hypothetical protein
MLGVAISYYYGEHHYAECRYTKCRSTYQFVCIHEVMFTQATVYWGANMEPFAFLLAPFHLAQIFDVFFIFPILRLIFTKSSNYRSMRFKY